MPVKWTPEIDQILLLKILETSDVAVKVKEISEAWPDTHERPTPRAISERIVKIRQLSKASGNGNGTSVSISGAKTNGSTNSTPRKPRVTKNGTTTPKKRTTAAKAPGSGKRKQTSGRMSDENLTDDSETADFKSASSDNESPKKKRKSNIKLEHEHEHEDINGGGDGTFDDDDEAGIAV